MIKINILLENFSVASQYESRHGLSVLMNFNDTAILLDVGPDNKFITNAKRMNIDLSGVKYLFLSHNHNDHTGGVNEFMEINNTAPIYLMDGIDGRYYAKFLFFYIPIGLKLKKSNYSRIIQVRDDLVMDDKIYFLKNTVSDYVKPTYNRALYKKENGKMVNDNFDHEGILVLEDDGELLILNSCSHNGILNIIETVRTKIPNKKIKGYVGGLHLCNPNTKEHEDDRYLDYLINEIKKTGIVVYTGHCTGKYALNYMQKKLGKMVQEINTGMELVI